MFDLFHLLDTREDGRDAIWIAFLLYRVAKLIF